MIKLVNLLKESVNVPPVLYHATYKPLLSKIKQDEFINKIKTDDEFAKQWGELGPVYGAGWRNWGGKSDDELYEDYLKKVKDK